MPAPEPADLALYATFFVSAVDTGLAKERVEPVVRAQGDELLGLLPVAALQHFGDGGLEVVIPDPGGNSTEMGERPHMAFEERFLRLGAVRDVKRPAGVR